MNKYLFFIISLTLLMSTFIVSGQSQSVTYIPDANFENYLEANGMGDGIALNNSVFTDAIDTVTSLDIDSLSIGSLEGVESFSSLSHLNCSGNLLTSLDLSQNTSLTYLDASNNGSLSFLNVTNGNNQSIAYFTTTGDSLLCGQSILVASKLDNYTGSTRFCTILFHRIYFRM